MEKECCANCIHLHLCDIVSKRKLSRGYKCGAWAEASDTEIAASESIMRDFGAWALSYDSVPLQQRRSVAKRKIRRRHRNG